MLSITSIPTGSCSGSAGGDGVSDKSCLPKSGIEADDPRRPAGGARVRLRSRM